MKTTQYIQRHLKFIIFTIVIGLIAVSLVAINFLEQIDEKFCTKEDNLYQTISANSGEWMSYFFNSPESATTTHLAFSSRNGRQFTAIKMDDLNSFFVATEYDYPHTYLGASGYVFSPNGAPEAWNEYIFTQIGEGVYCYKVK